MPDPRDWQCVQMPRSCPGGGGDGRSWNWLVHDTKYDNVDTIWQNSSSPASYVEYLTVSRWSSATRCWLGVCSKPCNGLHRCFPSGLKLRTESMALTGLLKRDSKSWWVVLWLLLSARCLDIHVIRCCICYMRCVLTNQSSISFCSTNQKENHNQSWRNLREFSRAWRRLHVSCAWERPLATTTATPTKTLLINHDFKGGRNLTTKWSKMVAMDDF